MTVNEWVHKWNEYPGTPKYGILDAFEGFRIFEMVSPKGEFVLWPEKFKSEKKALEYLEQRQLPVGYISMAVARLEER